MTEEQFEEAESLIIKIDNLEKCKAVIEKNIDRECPCNGVVLDLDIGNSISFIDIDICGQVFNFLRTLTVIRLDELRTKFNKL